MISNELKRSKTKHSFNSYDAHTCRERCANIHIFAQIKLNISFNKYNKMEMEIEIETYEL